MKANIIKMIIEELSKNGKVLVLSTDSDTHELVNDGGMRPVELLEAIKFILDFEYDILDAKMFNKEDKYTLTSDGKLLLIENIKVAGE